MEHEVDFIHIFIFISFQNDFFMLKQFFCHWIIDKAPKHVQKITNLYIFRNVPVLLIRFHFMLRNL